MNWNFVVWWFGFSIGCFFPIKAIRTFFLKPVVKDAVVNLNSLVVSTVTIVNVVFNHRGFHSHWQTCLKTTESTWSWSLWLWNNNAVAFWFTWSFLFTRNEIVKLECWAWNVTHRCINNASPEESSACIAYNCSIGSAVSSDNWTNSTLFKCALMFQMFRWFANRILLVVLFLSKRTGERIT